MMKKIIGAVAALVLGSAAFAADSGLYAKLNAGFNRSTISTVAGTILQVFLVSSYSLQSVFALQQLAFLISLLTLLLRLLWD